MDFKEPGDYKTEVHFIGQIVAGTQFDTSAGLFCEIHLEYGDQWRELPNRSEQGIQTQTSYPSVDELIVWAHPIDLHFSTNSIFGWPKFIIRVWRLDDVGRIDLLSYGVTALPCSPGYFKLECPTWRPIGTWQDEAMAFFIGGPPRLMNQDALTKEVGLRQTLKTVSSGSVIIEIEVMLRNFDVHWARSQIN
ncbi:unnamed protein product [Blepharisma stoltei]|uniref:B9 domain-containing protein 2 n=1 Tax=Blepharisma stoltei TaxID=1481888 RepID=A0AAU9IFN3_9CILI|nr:unnamed protein product [Blepharisma stoltei]